MSNAPRGVRFHDDVGELFRRREAPECADADLISATGVVEGGRLVERAGRHLRILGAQDVQDVACADAVRGCFVWIYPDPHGELPFAQNQEIRHAWKSCDLVSHMENEVIGEVFCAAAAVGRIRMHAKQERRNRFLDLDALQLNLFRQSG